MGFDPAQIRELARQDLDVALATLHAARPRLATADDRLTWAIVAHELGELDDAITMLAADEASDPRAAAMIGQLRAWADEVPEPRGVPEVAMESSEATPTPHVTDADIMLFIHRFAGREGVHARQWVRPKQRRIGYSPVEEPITPALVRAHLRGALTLGSYPIRLDGTVTWAVIDIDLTRKAIVAARRRDDIVNLKQALWTTLKIVRERLADLALPALIVDSGYKGRHLWLFFATPLPADLVHRLGRQLLRTLEVPIETHLEFFPKQGRVAEGGLGNLVKLPLGVHRKTDRLCALLGEDGRPVEAPWQALRDAPRIDRSAVLAALDTLRPPPVEVPGEPSKSKALEQVQARCPVLARLIEQARASRRLTHDQCVVLIHSLGHLPGGVDTINALFGACPEVPRHLFLKRVLSGCPISCARIRARVPEITAHEACHCAFTQTAHYPSPVLHASAD